RGRVPGSCPATGLKVRSCRSRERDPPRQSGQLLVLGPGRAELSPEVVDPLPHLVLAEPERVLALLPDRALRDGDRLEPARLRALEQRMLVQPALGRMSEGVRPENRLEWRIGRRTDYDRAEAHIRIVCPSYDPVE